MQKRIAIQGVILMKQDVSPADCFVLVLCEESGRVTKAFRKRGFHAWSVDLLPTSGDLPQYHVQADCIDILRQAMMVNKPDLVIAFPPCTYLTVAGNRWKNYPERQKKREEAAEFVFEIWEKTFPVPLAIENPVGWLNSHWRQPDQIINPYQFGNPFAKRTCLWLWDLPPLVPTNVLERPQEGWANQCFDKTGRNRGFKIRDPKMRSKTFPGIAEAMAEQWGKYILERKRNE